MPILNYYQQITILVSKFKFQARFQNKISVLLKSVKSINPNVSTFIRWTK